MGTSLIKNKVDGIEVEGEAVWSVWKSCFRDLLNEVNENKFEGKPVVEGPNERVISDELRAVIKGMKNKKASGPFRTLSDLFKHAGETSVRNCKNYSNEYLILVNFQHIGQRV